MSMKRNRRPRLNDTIITGIMTLAERGALDYEVLQEEGELDAQTWKEVCAGYDYARQLERWWIRKKEERGKD